MRLDAAPHHRGGAPSWPTLPIATFSESEAAVLLVECHGAVKAAQVAWKIAMALASAGDEAGAACWVRIRACIGAEATPLGSLSLSNPEPLMGEPLGKQTA